LEALISIGVVYFFVFLGFLAKKIFTHEIEEKSLILISIYFLQPILTFWGLTRTKIDFNLILTPFVYFITVTSTLIFLVLISKSIFINSKDRAIFTSTALIGNTGNLAIPLGIALFGMESVPYTSIINIANIFFIYTVGVYFLAREKYTLKQSIKSMLKIPILWFALFALCFNYFDFTINTQIDRALEMGAYSTIVLQLMIFGIYLAKVGFKINNLKLTISTSVAKLLLLPIVGIFMAIAFDLTPFIATILVVSLATPLAVNNVNLASLYDCKPLDVTSIILFSTISFLLIFYFLLQLIHFVFGAL
jgi:malate permease and related proteins